MWVLESEEPEFKPWFHHSLAVGTLAKHLLPEYHEMGIMLGKQSLLRSWHQNENQCNFSQARHLRAQISQELKFECTTEQRSPTAKVLVKRKSDIK